MKKIRSLFFVMGMLLSSVSSATVQVSIGINFPSYPNLVVVPGYPVYYAPQLDANYFFYDGMYWVYQNDYWYASSWYNGPWRFVGPELVPVFILRIPVRYYRQPPTFFIGWQSDSAPRWGEHWGRDWSQNRKGWDRWDRRSAPRPAALPLYQREYFGDRYPKQLEQQQELHQRNYNHQPRDPVVRQSYQEQSSSIRDEDMRNSPRTSVEQGRPEFQDQGRQQRQGRNSSDESGREQQGREQRRREQPAQNEDGERNVDMQRQTRPGTDQGRPEYQDRRQRTLSAPDLRDQQNPRRAQRERTGGKE